MSEDGTADGYSGWRTRPLPQGNWTMRVGKKIPRNLYIEWSDGRSEPVGQVDTAALAAFIASAVNKYIIWKDGDPGEAKDESPMFQNYITGNVGTHIQGDTFNNLTLE